MNAKYIKYNHYNSSKVFNMKKCMKFTVNVRLADETFL